MTAKRKIMKTVAFRNWVGDTENLNKILKNVELNGVGLENEILSSLHFKFEDVIFTNCQFNRVNFKGIAFEDCQFIKCKVQCCEFNNSMFYSNKIQNCLFDGCSFKGAIISHSAFYQVRLYNCDFTRAKFIEPLFVDVRADADTSNFNLNCPEVGEFIGFKKARAVPMYNACRVIVQLKILEDASRSSATTRKCRCSKALVMSITTPDGFDYYDRAQSEWDSSFIYEVGKVVSVTNFDENRWNECSSGIHFFMTRDEAVTY